MYICKGIGMVSYQGHPPTIKDPVITALPTTTFLGIPFITWVAIVMFLLCFFYSGVYRLRPAYLRRGHQ